MINYATGGTTASTINVPASAALPSASMVGTRAAGPIGNDSSASIGEYSSRHYERFVVPQPAPPPHHTHLQYRAPMPQHHPHLLHPHHSIHSMMPHSSSSSSYHGHLSLPPSAMASSPLISNPYGMMPSTSLSLLPPHHPIGTLSQQQQLIQQFHHAPHAHPSSSMSSYAYGASLSMPSPPIATSIISSPSLIHPATQSALLHHQQQQQQLAQSAADQMTRMHAHAPTMTTMQTTTQQQRSAYATTAGGGGGV